MKKSKVISLVLLLFLVLTLILSPSVAAQGSDPQEAIIKQVLAETGAEFGWDIGDCIYGNIICTEIRAGKVTYGAVDQGYSNIKLGAHYDLHVPVGDSEGMWEITPMAISAYPTEAVAEVAIAEYIEIFRSSGFNIKATTFHNLSAFSICWDTLIGHNIEWQAGRFHFSTGFSLDRGSAPPPRGDSRGFICQCGEVRAHRWGRGRRCCIHHKCPSSRLSTMV